MKLRHRVVRKMKWLHLKGQILFEGNLARCQKIHSGNFPSHTILFYPDEPTLFAALWKICLWSNCRISNDPNAPFDLAVYWDGRDIRRPDDVLLNIAKQSRVININCYDFSKTTVNKVFAHAFGYELAVDPREHEGSCVKKSDRNATHDGQVITCPIDEIEEGYVYQKLINNEVGEDLIADLRVPFFRDRIPLVYVKYRKKSDRFSNENEYVELVGVREQFSAQEQSQIISFCGLLGLEYGELDVLRDGDDQRIYVVDANPTPFGPPNHINNRDRKLALNKLTTTFENTFLADL